MNITLNELTEQAETLINQMHELFLRNVPQKGNTADDCCAVELTNKLMELQQIISSMSQDDLTPDDDWLIINQLSGFVYEQPECAEAV